MLRTVPVDVEQLQLLGLTVEPKADFETKAQKTTRDGTPVWTVTAYSVAEAGDLKISVPSPLAPEVQAGQRIEFLGLRVGVYSSGDRAAFYWTAESVLA